MKILDVTELAEWMRHNPRSARAAIDDFGIREMALYIENEKTEQLGERLLAALAAQMDYERGEYDPTPEEELDRAQRNIELKAFERGY